jgi:hypothetical protein
MTCAVEQENIKLKERIKALEETIRTLKEEIRIMLINNEKEQ